MSYCKNAVSVNSELGKSKIFIITLMKLQL